MMGAFNSKLRFLFHRIAVLFLVPFLAVAAAPMPQALAVGTNQSNGGRFNVVLVVDASGSMQQTDPDAYRFEAVAQFAGLLAEQGNYLGGVVFSTGIDASEALAAADSKDAKDAVVGTLRSVAAEGGYTNIGAALTKAVDEVESHGDPNLPAVIVLFSDGVTDMPTQDDVDASLAQKAEAIQRAREDGIRIYTICLNANNVADTEIRQISDATGGAYQEVKRAEDLQDVFNAFYALIYGTSTTQLADVTFPTSGVLETPFDVPGMGVEEVNIIIYGTCSDIVLTRPDGKQADASVTSSATFTMLKVTDPPAGTWKLTTKGAPGDQIKINMVYNVDLGVEIEADAEQGKSGMSAINPEDALVVRAYLTESGKRSTAKDDYDGYAAELELRHEENGDVLERIPMKLDDKLGGVHFELSHTLDEGVYFYSVHVAGNGVECTSETAGPLNVTTEAIAELDRTNTPPTPVVSPLEETVLIWPFRDNSYTLDLATLATDEQDAELAYKVVSSSFLDDDYAVDGTMLTLSNFSMPKGAFTVRATDSRGLSCDVEVIITSHNVGIMALIGLAVAALVAAVVIGILLWIALTRPFRGDIMVQSYVDGVTRGERRSPRRGRCKLAAFGLDPTGLDYRKSYIQATGKSHVILCTNVPVQYAGETTTKVQIDSGVEVMVTVLEGRQLIVRFDSRMRR